jgi:hypothetical protein
MAAEGVFPKVDGDVLYASEANTFFNIVPIGAILPWAKSITGVPTLPSNFVECSGQTLSDADSPLNGQTIPNLNGDARFLYGAATSGGTKSENYLPSHTHEEGTLKYLLRTSTGESWAEGTTNVTTQYTGSIDGATATTTAGTAWTGYAVVMIMRVK